MNDTTIAADAARVTAETEASREIASQAASDNPNPPAPDAAPLSDVAGEGTAPPEGAKPLERITTSDRGRADIAARFKEKRAAQGGQVEFHGDMRDPSQTYGPYAGQLAEQRTEETQPAQPPAETQAQPVEPVPPSSGQPEAPRLIKVKVHGREAFLPEADVIAEAQKSLAAGNLLETAKEVLAGARGQDAGEPAPAQAGVRHPSSEPDPYTELAQTLQLDGAEVAGSKLRATIESETAKARQEAAREAARQVRLETELAASQRAMQAFETAHPELGSDEFARDAITTQVQREINADLRAAVAQGILKELPRSQDERNGLHTQLRAFGAPVRGMSDIFDAASGKYATWRGAQPAPRPATPQPQPITQPNPTATAPRVELTTARQERRAAIPTQPTSGTVPPRAAAPPVEQTMAQRRSAAVMAMRKARGQITA
jgi:hypothetical protein